MTDPVLSFEGVTKRFGELTAVDDLSFAVPAGGIFGFLGGNGAGKTTSLRMALDILAPTSGRIEVLGAPPSRENAAAIGFLPEERGLYRRMTALDTIVYFGRLKRMEAGAARKAAMRLLERLDLADRAKTPVAKLSKGLAQKVQVATALVNAPRLLLVDEPTASLDPKTSRQIMRLLVELCAERGLAAIVNIHDVALAQQFARRIVGLRAGRIVFDGPADALGPDELTAIYGEEDWSQTIRKVEDEEDDVVIA